MACAVSSSTSSWWPRALAAASAGGDLDGVQARARYFQHPHRGQKVQAGLSHLAGPAQGPSAQGLDHGDQSVVTVGW